MGTFLVYILKSALCLALFYLFYKLLLSKETFHRFNRFALLGVLLLSALVPLIEVSVAEPQVWQQDFTQLEVLQEPTPYAAVVEQPAFSWTLCLLVVYALGVLFFVVRHLYSLSRLLLLLRRGTCEPLSNYVDSTKQARLVVHEQELAPFSWMKVIVVRRKDLEENGREILIHELAHIGKHHSWDLLLADLCIFLQWFNPAVWLLKQELQTIHEYEADESVINEGVDERKYQLLLIRKAVGTRLYSMANSFNHSSLKKRITMMSKEKSSPWARMKYAYVLPLAAMAVTAFARPEVANVSNEISSAKVSDLIAVLETNEAEKSKDDKVKVSGKVIDAETGEAIPGVSLIVKGTNSGMISDKDGSFSLMVEPKSVLVASYIGMQTTNIVITEKQKNLVIPMRVEVQQLDEMVVVGIASEEEPQKPAKKSEPSKLEEPEEEVVFEVVEQMPEYPGGMGEMMKYLGQNIKYPQDAQQARIEGRVVVQFVVDREGNVQNPSIRKGVSPSLDAEALRVISGMPRWNPGKQRGKAVNVHYTVPVMFRLQKPAKTDNTVRIRHDKDAPEATPLVIVEGKQMPYQEFTSKLDPKRIASITVLKQEAATEKYGEAAKNGVIIVELKKEGEK